MAKILIVEDDALVSDILRTTLSGKRHVVEQIADGAAAIECISHYKYDLIVLDWQLPSFSGPQIAKHAKERSPNTMILMLTSKSQVQDKVDGFTAGADDYMTKPVDIAEFGSRVLALLRRAGLSESRQLTYKNLVLDLDSGVLRNDTKQVTLPPKEFELLELLMKHTDTHLSTESLLERLWQGTSSRAALANCLKRLRNLLGTLGYSDCIETAPSLGYRLKPFH
jgi:DNA-binding response OmpR family regulator